MTYYRNEHLHAHTCRTARTHAHMSTSKKGDRRPLLAYRTMGVPSLLNSGSKLNFSRSSSLVIAESSLAPTGKTVSHSRHAWKKGRGNKPSQASPRQDPPQVTGEIIKRGAAGSNQWFPFQCERQNRWMDRSTPHSIRQTHHIIRLCNVYSSSKNSQVLSVET